MRRRRGEAVAPRPLRRVREKPSRLEGAASSPLKSSPPARLPCQLWLWAQRMAAAEPEVPVLCAAVHLGSDTGQSHSSYANGNQMGRESPVVYRRRREACVFLCSYAERGPALLPRSPLFSSSRTSRRYRTHILSCHWCKCNRANCCAAPLPPEPFSPELFLTGVFEGV